MNILIYRWWENWNVSSKLFRTLKSFRLRKFSHSGTHGTENIFSSLMPHYMCWARNKISKPGFLNGWQSTVSWRAMLKNFSSVWISLGVKAITLKLVCILLMRFLMNSFTSWWIRIRLAIIFRMVFPRTKYLKFNFQTFRYILCHTTSPLPGAYDSGAIHGVLRNTLNGLYLGYVSDNKDVFMHQLVNSAEENEAEKKIINWCAKERILCSRSSREIYPSCQRRVARVEIYSKGKAFRDNSSKALEKVVSLKISRSKPVSKPSILTQLDISLRTQQLLLRHVDNDQTEK